MPGFGEAVVVEADKDAAPIQDVARRRRGLFGPGEDFVQGLGSATQAGLVGDLLQTGNALLTHRIGRGGVTGEDERRGAVVPEVAEEFRVAGHGGMKDFTDLTLQDGVLVDQVAAMAAEQLDGEVVIGPGRFEQAEAVGGGPPDGGQVGVVGLVAGVGGLTVLLGREGMDQARFEVGLAEGVLHRAMVFAGAFDGDDEVGQLVLAHGLADAVDGGLEVAAVVGHGRRFKQCPAVEVGEEVAGAGFGAVDGDDAEVFRSHSLDAWGELATGFLQDEGLADLPGARRSRTWHGSLLLDRGKVNPQPERQSRGREENFSSSLTPIPRWIKSWRDSSCC